MVDFPSIPGPKEEFKDFRKLYDRLLLSVFPISGYTLDRSYDPILTCNFHCAKGRKRHVDLPGCPFVITAERVNLRSPWIVMKPLEYDHDHEPIPLERPRRGTALAEALEKFGVGDDFWVDGSDGAEDSDEEQKPSEFDEDEDQLGQDAFGSTPPVQEQPLSPDGLRYLKRQKLKVNGRAQGQVSGERQANKGWSDELEVIDLTGEDDDDDEEYEARREAGEQVGEIVDESEQGQKQGEADDSGVFVGSDIGEYEKSGDEAVEEDEGRSEEKRNETPEAVPSQYTQFKRFLNTLHPEFPLEWWADTLWDRPFLIRSESQLIMVARNDLKGLMELFRAETGAFGPACALRQGLEDVLDRE